MKIAHYLWQKRIKKKTINNMRLGRMTFLTSSHITVRITRFLYSSRHLTFDAMQRFGLPWPRC